ncbi:MAG TPA: hypothetical protein VLF59_03715 [Candidatus Saccharimonadales bacterium]|nr:hypothetical protein [Candidatus Saccharimonadales bacterium]
MRDQLNTEITRKQFLQYLAAAALALFGLNNLLSLLTGNHRDVQRILVNSGNTDSQDGFGSRRFGV